MDLYTNEEGRTVNNNIIHTKIYNLGRLNIVVTYRDE